MAFLISNKDIEKIASFDITNTHNLYDPKFGSAGSIELDCVTCGMKGELCMGHHASMSLGTSMFHPLVYKNAELILNNTCLNCGTKLPPIIKVKSRKCIKCQTKSFGDYIIKSTNLEYAVRINKKNYIAASDILENILPDGYIVSKILVPPINMRNTEDMEWSSDLNKLYQQLIYLIENNKYSSPSSDDDEDAKPKKKDTLNVPIMYTKIVGAFRKDGVLGIMSGKEGIFRKIMLGKRVNSCARAVIVGDPSIELDEIAIPKLIYRGIKVKIFCNTENIKTVKNMASNDLIWWENTEDNVKPNNIMTGITYERLLQNGDLLLLNRQPSLSRHSMMCFRVKLRNDDYNVFGINPQVTSPFNADFDGDEMNVFFMKNRAEMIELCHLSKCVVDTDKKKVVVVPVQDLVTGCYIMSLQDEQVDKKTWDQCIVFLYNNRWKSMPGTTRDLLSMCIENYDGKSVLTKKEIVKFIYDIDGQKALNMLQKLQSVVLLWLSYRGLTVSLKSIVTPTIYKRKNESYDVFKERCEKYAEKRLSGTDIMHIIKSGAKGTVLHASHMAVALGQQKIKGKQDIFCKNSYYSGLTPNEFFGHQMAAREGVVSTGVGTATTGYLNRKACKILADIKLQYNGTLADNFGISSFTIGDKPATKKIDLNTSQQKTPISVPNMSPPKITVVDISDTQVPILGRGYARPESIKRQEKHVHNESKEKPTLAAVNPLSFKDILQGTIIIDKKYNLTLLESDNTDKQIQQYCYSISKPNTWVSDFEVRAAENINIDGKFYKIQIYGKSGNNIILQYPGSNKNIDVIKLYTEYGNHYKCLDININNNYDLLYHDNITIETGSGGDCFFFCLAYATKHGKKNQKKADEIRMQVAEYLLNNYKEIETYNLKDGSQFTMTLKEHINELIQNAKNANT